MEPAAITVAVMLVLNGMQWPLTNTLGIVGETYTFIRCLALQVRRARVGALQVEV